LRDLDSENSVEIHAFEASDVDIEVSLKQGDRVVALVQPAFWAKNGKLTMRVLKMHKVGLGELLERIEKLRQQIIKEGLTDPSRKKPLPFLPGKIGLVTGANSDAEKDVLQNARNRWPEVQFEVIHTLVQGDRAAAEIIMAIQQLDAMADVDVIIVARGGGSFQDLLPFSDERLVRAAAALTKPLVSAIGHENDQPLLDLVADLRASTPTDAAKRVVPDVLEERKTIQTALDRINFRIMSFIETQLQLIKSIISRPVLASPFGFVDNQADQLEKLTKRLAEILDWKLTKAGSELGQLVSSVRALSPKLTLERGYALVTNENGEILREVAKDQDFTVQLAKQEIMATAKSVRKK
jgi:exodeoxyribonuclease VII large subunit